MQRFPHTLLRALGLFALTAPSFAAQLEVCQSETIPPQTTGWTSAVSVDLFDPDLGVLEEVRVSLSCTISGSASLENTSSKPVTHTSTFSASCSVVLPQSSNVLAVVTPERSQIVQSTAFDGVIDFAGTSGFTFPGIVESASTTAPLSGTDLNFFIGNGGAEQPGTVLLPVSVSGTSTASGNGNLVLQFMQEAEATVEICYVYRPDCDENGVPDDLDIANGAADVNLDGVPDACTPGLSFVCEQDSLPSTLTDWNDQVTVNRFDPDLGFLEQVTIQLLSNLSGSVGVENTDSMPREITLHYAADVVLSRPGGGGTLVSVTPFQDFLFSAAASDGNSDFTGPSGILYTGIFTSGSSTEVILPPSSDLALFTGMAGAGPPGMISLPMNSVRATTVSGTPSSTRIYTGATSAVVKVVYSYRLDCNSNGVPDDLDSQAVGADQNGNLVPDECEPQDSFCNGDGGDQLGCVNCPCMNNRLPGTLGGCLNSSGNSTRLASSGSASVSLPSGSVTDLRFTTSGAPPNTLSILISGTNLAPQNMANPCFGLGSGTQAPDRDGLRCVVQDTLRHGGRSTDGLGLVMSSTGPSRVWGGEATPPAGIAGQAGFVAGQTRFFQVTHREDATLVCMRGLNTSQALRVTFAP